jgi:oxygen-dependent protoporphyrinogen oxidase
MFNFIDRTTLAPILELRYAKVVQVIAAYRKWNGMPLNAFGGLIPSIEKRDALGILFTSSIFSSRAPEGGAVLSVFMGGDRRPELIDKSDDEIREIALKEINSTLGNPAGKKQDTANYQQVKAKEEHQAKSTTTRAEDRKQSGTKRGGHFVPDPVLKPDHLEIFRYPYAIPQYEASTEQRLEAIERIEEAFPGIHLAGNIRDGIGIADRVKQGYRVAQQIISS